MVYLFLGADLKTKDIKISQIKKSLFKSVEAHHYDFESLDAIGIAPDTLKKALMTLPVLNPTRLVILYNVHKLKIADIASLLHFVKNPPENIDLILETGELTLKGDFKEIVPLCQAQVCDAGNKANVFDMTKLMVRGQDKDALLMLSGFYQEGTHPLQILGGLAWFWGKDGRRLAAPQFENGLKALEDADINIKRSRLDAHFAVEKVVVELTGLFRSARR
jgi:DNA polymerase III delta subunit